MATTINILRKLGCKVEDTAGTYDAPDTQLGITSASIKEAFALIPDESVMGVAFQDLPLQGIRTEQGNVEMQFDVLSVHPILEAGFGDESSGTYSCPATKNEKTLSFVEIDEVKTYKNAGCVLNNLEIKSEAEGDLKLSCDVLGWRVQVKDDTGFPAVTVVPGIRLQHSHCGGTNGYARIADQANALGSGDNQNITSLACGINWNFTEVFYNATGTLQLLSGSGGRPEATFSFTVAEHSADTWHTYKENRTALQAEILYYAAAAAQLKISVPNFVIEDVEKTDDDIPKINVTCKVARNGIGTAYSNANMEFVTPIQAILTNS